MNEKTEVAKNEFDRLMGSLADLNETVRTRETVIRHIPMWGVGDGAKTFIVQTIRQREIGDYIFVECVSESGTVRLVLPPEVAQTIARQRDSLTTKNRSKSSRASMQERMERGERPGFLRGKARG